MRTVSVSLIAFVMAITVGYTGGALAQATFTRVKSLPGVKQVEVEQPTYSSETAALALRIHNIMSSLKDFQEVRKQLIDAQENFEVQQLRFRSLTACNINNLTPYFKDSQIAWQKLADKYDLDEKKLSIDINTLDPGAEETGSLLSGVQGAAKYWSSDVEESVGEDLSEAFLQWSLGAGILADFYANQDKYADRVDKSFPLTADQAYVYDKDVWFKKYKALNQVTCCRDNCGVGYNGAPDTRENGYDYHTDYKYHEDGKVKKAHDAYLVALGAVKVGGLGNTCQPKAVTADLKNVPAMPPKPLPPTNEQVTYFTLEMSPSNPPYSEHLIYKNGQMQYTESAWPAPWQTFIDSGFKTYNPSGEMASEFVHKTTTLTSSSSKSAEEAEASFDRRNNRLNAYQQVKKELDDGKKILDLSKVSYLETFLALKEQIKDLNTDIVRENAKIAAAAEESKESKDRTIAVHIGELKLPENFALLDNFDTANLMPDLDRIVVKDNTILYRKSPDVQLAQWPNSFDIKAGGGAEGELMITPDDRGVGLVYLRQVQTLPTEDFDLITAKQIEEMKAAFLPSRNALIGKAETELSSEMTKDQTATKEEQEVMAEIKQKMAAVTEGKATLQAMKDMIAGQSAGLDFPDKDKFFERAVVSREASDDYEFPNVMVDISKANTATILKAMRDDVDADLLLTKSNAKDLSDLTEQRRVIKELRAEWEQGMKEVAVQGQKKLDANCLNMGVSK